MTNYQMQWLLAVALKRPYPRPEAGALDLDTKETQMSILKLTAGAALLGLASYALLRK